LSTRFVEPPRKRVVTELPEALRRKRDACSRINRSYIFNKTTDKNILDLSIYAQKYPTLIRDILLTVCRTKLVHGTGTFETDDNGTINDKVTEALVYTIRREVMDPHNPDTVVLRHCTIKEGVYSRPFAAVNKNDDDEIVGSEIAFWKTMFYIPFTKENVLKVLAEHNNQYRNLVCAYALERGDHFHNGTTFNIPNLEEFISVPFETLVQANKLGVLTSEFGGHIRYLKDQEQKRKQLELEVAEFKAESDSNSSNKSKSKRK
jgi:hypothetical protein